MSDWLPIESAPRDGTKVLVGCNWHPMFVVASFKNGKWTVSWDAVPLDEDSGWDELTHWAPISPMPEYTEGK
jgi:hypothetical protein